MAERRSEALCYFHMDIQPLQHNVLEWPSFPHGSLGHSCHLSAKSPCHMSVCLFLESLLYFIGIFSLFLPIPYCCSNCYFIINRPGHYSLSILFKKIFWPVLSKMCLRPTNAILSGGTWPIFSSNMYVWGWISSHTSPKQRTRQI